MKAKTKFREMFHKLPDRAKNELVMRFSTHPMTLRVVALEIENNTTFGKGLLRELGFEDD